MDENNVIVKDINICFLAGKIITTPKFSFFYNSRNYISKVVFILKIGGGFVSSKKSKNCYIKVVAINEMADLVYRNFDINDLIQFRGFLNENYVQLTSLFK